MSEADPFTATDQEWSEAYGMCGGCGDSNDTCHPGATCVDVDSWYGPVCNDCDLRRKQGLIP